LHSNDYIHHDVKCQNILVDRVSGNLKLGDLLCAEKLDNKKYFTKYIGTEEFMAPEVKEGKYSFKADIYSLGITLIQLITMEKPYKEFQRKIDIDEAKKKGAYPLSFNQIKNNEIKNFISLCLKEEKYRPTCKELLTNKWLNDNESPDHYSYLEVINNLRQQNFKLDKKVFSNNMESGLINKGISPFTSCNSLINPKLQKQASMGPIYSLDISKV
jgi:serine/threonine protein kinase